MASAGTPKSGSSPVWGDRGFHLPAAGESRAPCKVCGKKLTYRGSKHGTSHLLRHMNSPSCLRRAASEQQQQEVVAPPVVVGEPFQPSGQQVHYYSTTTTITDVVDAAELNPYLLPLPQAAPTAAAAAGFFQPRGQVCDAAATAFADPLQLHGHGGGVAEGFGAYAPYSSISNVHQAAVAAPDDDFAYQDTMIDLHLWDFTTDF